MIKWLVRLILGDTCKHQWEMVGKKDLSLDCTMLFKCDKCGRFKSKTI